MNPPQSGPSRICRLLDWMPPRWVLLALVCLVLVLRGQAARMLADSFRWDPDLYMHLARSIASEGIFAFDSGGGVFSPTASRPPLYPLLLSLLVPFGIDHQFGAAAMNAALGTATVCAVWYLGRSWLLRPGACLLACALVTIDPILVAQSARIMTESLAALLATLALIAMTHWSRNESMFPAAAAGVAGGLCVLCRPEFLVFLLAALCAFPFVAAGARRSWRFVACLAWAALVIGPWAIRNYNVVGRPVATTTHGGLTLLVANNPDFYRFLRTAPWGVVWDGKAVYDAQPALGASDEVEQDWENYRRAFTNIRAEPAIFARSCLVRVGRLWNVLPHRLSADESPSRRGMRWAVAIGYVFEFALAAAGMWFLGGKLLRAPWVWGTLLALSITAVHAFYWSDMRMRAPLAGTVALTAAWGLSQLACRKPDASG